MSLPSIQIVHYNITVALGLKWHTYLICHMPRCKMKNTCKNRSKGPVLIGLEEIVQRQVGVGVGRGR